jgi:hypothetical protein
MNRALVLFCTLALLGGALPAGAADGGLAYDAVSKFLPSVDANTVEPGDFAADYETASKVADAPPSHGGMLGRLQNQIAAAGGMMAALHNGMAERHFIAGTKERTDYPSLQKADIVDCSTRTITSLDLKAKTYTVTSLDAPVTHSSSGGHSAPGPSATDDGTKLAITIANHALGAKAVSGVSAQGYASDITMVATKANGDSSTSKMNLKEYISKTPRVSLVCSAGGHASTASLPGAGMMSQYTAMMAALGTKNSRFSFSSSGPALPAAQLPVFEAVGFTAGGSDRGASGQSGQLTVVTERGNVRAIGAADPVFSVPADFTKTN